MKIRQFSERIRVLVELCGGVVITVWIMLGFFLGLFESLELLMYDWRFNLRGEREPQADILIITIDEESETALGRTPWPRTLHADFVNMLMQYHPQLIIYDVIFKNPTEEAEDEALANALYDAYDEEREMSLVILAQYISDQKLEQPLEMFGENAGGLGLINLHKDQDDIVRSTPVSHLQVDGEQIQYNLWLALETATLYKGGGVNRISAPRKDTLVLSRADEKMTEEVVRVVAPEGKLYINFIGGSRMYPMIPFWKILKGAYQPEEIEGKVIFIGDTMLTSHDYYLTPFRTPARKYLEELRATLPENAQLPKSLSTFGIEIHAQAFQTILENSYIRKINRYWSLAVIFFVGSLSGIILFKDRRLLINTALLLGALGLVGGIGQYAFNAWNFWIELAPLLVVVLLNYVGGLAFQRAIERYNRNKIKGAFQQYVSVAVVDEMLQHPEKLHLGGERKHLTALFSDIRGFTSISERMESQDLVEFLNEYLTAMTDIVMAYHGTLDKYMGDAIMAIYGAPIEQENHVERACESALDMIARLRELQPKWQERGKPVIDIGIGINSGLMTVGNMGSEKRFDFTVMGDHVNLASRLEGTNKQYGTNIIVSQYTYQEVKEKFVTRELDLARVKGKKEPVRIYELLGRMGEVGPDMFTWIDRFHQGIEDYRQQRWTQAIEHFNRVLNLHADDAPARLYIQRCQAYQQTPPPANWDGVYTMTTK